MSEEWHGKLDLRTRIRINERVGYRSKHVSMAELFNKLGKDYNNRQDYGQIMGIIQKDRYDFCKKIWDVAEDMLCEHTLENYKMLYKLCLRRWYKSNRTLLYKLGDAWGTPLKYEIFKKLEEEFARRDVQLIVNKIRLLELTNIELPYSIDTDTLELELKKTRELEGKSEEEEILEISEKLLEKKILEEEIEQKELDELTKKYDQQIHELEKKRMELTKRILKNKIEDSIDEE